MDHKSILTVIYNNKSLISGWVRPVAPVLYKYNTTSTIPVLNSPADTAPPAVGFGTQPFGMAAISTNCGLNVPVERYVCVTEGWREISVPLLSPKSQVKVMSDPLRYWLGSCTPTLKVTGRFWIKLWSAWLTSPVWDRVTTNGIWSEEGTNREFGVLCIQMYETPVSVHTLALPVTSFSLSLALPPLSLI